MSIPNHIPRIFACTPRYLQGPDALAQAGALAAEVGNSPAILIDAAVKPLVWDMLSGGFTTPPACEDFFGEVTDANITAIAARLDGVGVIIAVGGGKALDAGKAAAMRLGLPVITAPTIASTDGPASRGIAVYDPAHRLIRVDQMPANPAAVIVDSKIIAAAPVRFLRAGIGDAIAKTFEAEACWASGGLTKHGTRPTHAGRAIARAAYDLLRQHAAAALEAAERNSVTEDLEAVIEATVLLSAMGFENGGLSIAHAATRGLMILRGAENRLHGEQVAYGTMLHLAVAGRSEADLLDMAGFLNEVGLPDSLQELCNRLPGEADYAAIAAAIMASPHKSNLDRPVTEDALIRSMKHIETLASAAP